MREIKFRAWDSEEGAMIDADAWTFGDESAPFVDLVRAAQNEYKLMQYTGLKDKNGREIYEGDVVLYTDDGGRAWMGPLAKPMIIEFHKGAFQAVQNGAAYFQGDDITKEGYVAQAEVIGNIHDNPELLEK